MPKKIWEIKKEKEKKRKPRLQGVCVMLRRASSVSLSILSALSCSGFHTMFSWTQAVRILSHDSSQIKPVLCRPLWRNREHKWNGWSHWECRTTSNVSKPQSYRKPRPTVSDKVIYLAVAPPIEPLIYSKEIFLSPWSDYYDNQLA